MKQISFESIGAVVATFQCGDDIAMGEVVMVTDSDTVEASSTSGAFCGVALSDEEENGYVAVQVGGFATVSYTGTVAKGFVTLAADGSGGVKTVTSGGREHLVVSVDSTEGTAVIRL